MGSLSTGTNISDITYRNIYTWSSNQMYMIKSNGGDGTVSNVLLENFIGMIFHAQTSLEQHEHRRRRRRSTQQHHLQQLEGYRGIRR
jgi:hypothetical protein